VLLANLDLSVARNRLGVARVLEFKGAVPARVRAAATHLQPAILIKPAGATEAQAAAPQEGIGAVPAALAKSPTTVRRTAEV
jgi:hypothetical protein